MRYNQTSFLGGLAAQFNRVRPDVNSYPLLCNGRIRDDVVDPIRSPLEDTSVRAGLKQGITAVGSIIIVFVAGKAFYRDVSTTNSWRQVTGLNLDSTAAEVDATAIPASTINFKRSGPIDAVKFNNSSARETPEGILATEGITQPYLIYPVGNAIQARVTYTYDQWRETEDGMQREYVPIGRFPRFVGKKLFMAIRGSTGYLNRIAQSVSGRPLDFVMNINDETGDKEGDALTTCYSTGFDELTGLYAVNNMDSLISCTLRSADLISLDPTNTSFFGEPKLDHHNLFPVGIPNTRSAANLNGDIALITTPGIISFNATQQTKIAANSDPLSRQIQRLLAPVQTYGAAVEVDNYALFAVETKLGPGIVVYDKTLGETGRFVAIDVYAGVGAIKAFTKATTPEGERVFFITADDRLFEYNAGETRETCRFFMGDWSASDAKTAQKFDNICAVFVDVYEPTIVQVTEYVDQAPINRANYPALSATKTNGAVVPIPAALVDRPAAAYIHYQAPQKRSGLGCGAMIEWNTSAKLAFVTMETQLEVASPQTLATLYLRSSQEAAVTVKLAFCGNFEAGTVDPLLYRLPPETVVLGLGNQLYGNPTEQAALYATTLSRLVADHRFYSVGGAVDVDVDGGLVFRTKFGNGKRYGVYQFGSVDVFFFNVGWDTATIGTGATPWEPDGITATSRQGRWLQAALARSTARFKIVVLAFPPYGGDPVAAGYTDLRLPFRAWGATAVVSGYYGNYQRLIVGDLPYFVVGTGGKDPESVPANGTAQTYYQDGRNCAGFLTIEADAFNLTTAHVGVDGTVFDRFAINT